MCRMDYYPKPKYADVRPRVDTYESLLVYTRTWVKEERKYAEIRNMRGYIKAIIFLDDDGNIVEEEFV